MGSLLQRSQADPGTVRMGQAPEGKGRSNPQCPFLRSKDQVWRSRALTSQALGPNGPSDPSLIKLRDGTGERKTTDAPGTAEMPKQAAASPGFSQNSPDIIFLRTSSILIALMIIYPYEGHLPCSKPHTGAGNSAMRGQPTAPGKKQRKPFDTFRSTEERQRLCVGKSRGRPAEEVASVQGFGIGERETGGTKHDSVVCRVCG